MKGAYKREPTYNSHLLRRAVRRVGNFLGRRSLVTRTAFYAGVVVANLLLLEGCSGNTISIDSEKAMNGRDRQRESVGFERKKPVRSDPVTEAVEGEMRNGYYSTVAKMAKKYGLSAEDIKNIAKRVVKFNIKEGYHLSASKTAEEYGLDAEEMKDIARKVMVELNNEGNYSAAAGISRRYGLDDDALNQIRVLGR